VTLADQIASPDFLIAIFAAISAAAIVFTFGAHIFERIERKDRMKKVALEREQMRAREMARMRNQAAGKENPRANIRGADARAYMKSTVERFSLQKAFMDENTIDRLAQAGLRGQGELTKHLFLRFVTPFVLFALGLVYLVFIAPGGRPVFINVVYAIGVGLVGAYVPVLLLRNKIQKRQPSIWCCCAWNRVCRSSMP
jgi:tight adherence protein C